MADELLLIWVVFFLCLSTQKTTSSLPLEFSFNGFKNESANITLNGVAEIETDGAIRLTPKNQSVLGHAFYSQPVKFKNSQNKTPSFSTAFAFAMVPQYSNPSLGGHGLAFAISPSRDLPGALPRQFLGLLNNTDIGNFSNHIFAVEFDSVRDLEFGDEDDNHIGIDIDSLRSNMSVPAAYFLKNSTKHELILSGGTVIQAWIDYDSVKTRLDVRISPFSEKPKPPILSIILDLSPILESEMFIGFSSSTGSLASSHYILGWNFNMSGQAMSLNLSSLPPIPGLQTKKTKKKNKKSGLILGISISISVLIMFILFLGFYFFRKNRNEDIPEDWEIEIGPRRFTYKELKIATMNFSEKELLGFGGFGKVYRGTLPDTTNTEVAVKRVSHESKQGIREFCSEISSIGRLRHRNLVQLLGWCRRRRDLLLVYDFMPNGSLDRYLFVENPKTVLNWSQRFKIIKGVASGLLYLHEGWEQTVIHRDIKAGNVLLDSDMNGRLGDFGLAKLYDREDNADTTRVVGTLGYLAPELTKSGRPTTKTDVYAFGAVVLEVVCGRRPAERKAVPEELILVDWVWEKWKKGEIFEVVDKRLKGEFDESEVVKTVKLGLLCSNNCPKVRPTMRQVLSFLDGESELTETVLAPDFSDEKRSFAIAGGGGDTGVSSFSGGGDERNSWGPFSSSE